MADKNRRERVIAARNVQQACFRYHDHLFCSAMMKSKDLRTFCRIDEQTMTCQNGDYDNRLSLRL